MAKEPSDLKTKLKKADPDIRRYVVQLEARNAKLHRSILDMEAEKVDRNNRIKALEQQWKEKKVDIQIRTDVGRLSPQQIKEEITRLLPSVISTLRGEGYTVIPPKAA